MTQHDQQPPQDGVSAEAVLEISSVAGASISTLGGLLGSETLSASDEIIARIDEIQFDLGEGPCWDAMTTGRPVLEPDLRRRSGATWPAFMRAVTHDKVAALFAIPLNVGPLRLGAIDMYDVRPRSLDKGELTRAVALAADGAARCRGRRSSRAASRIRWPLPARCPAGGSTRPPDS